ncbi:purine-cytosine permease family protein [Lentibacillus salinarum]|uniref:Purine-cytosine permease family protein n=1 Tax=Lentibacillus salinarum TaxID=446820 RepID=A0ABW3ZU29_9BACI
MNKNSIDIAPVPATKRDAGPLSMFWLFAGGNVLLAAFMVGSDYAETLGLVPMIMVTIFGNLAAYTICAWSAQKNIKYGLDEAISHRPAFGYYGALFGVFLIVFITIGWVGILSSMTGTAGQMVMETITGGYTFPGDYSIYALGGGIVIPLLLLLINPKMGFKVANITVPLMIIFSIIMLFQMLSAENLSAISSVEPTGEFGWMYAFEVIFAFAVVWLPYLGAWNKFSKKERGGFWGTYLGLALVGMLFGIIGGLATLLTGKIDPTLWMAELNLGIFGFVIVILGTITSCAILLYAAIMAVLTVFPKWKFHLVALCVAAPSIIFVFQGTLRDIFDLVLIFGGMLAGPYWAIILADYFILRKRKINLKACFDPKGVYSYFRGINPIAVIAQIVGMLLWIYIGGWMTGFEIITFASGDAIFTITSATLPAMIVSGTVYVILARRYFKGKLMGDYHLNDYEEENRVGELKEIKKELDKAN